MEILNVSLSPKVVNISDLFHLSFSVIGAEGSTYFIFPFSNESLSEPLIQFKQKEEAV